MTAFLLPPLFPPHPSFSRPHLPRPPTALLPAIAATAAAATLLISTPLPLSTLAQQSLPPVQHLPSPTSLIDDPAHIFTTGQATRLATRLQTLQADTGLRLLIKTTRGESGSNNRHHQPHWSTPDATTVILFVNRSAGNVLSFFTGTDVANFGLPQSFWVEAANRFGNVFAVRETGIDGAVESVIHAVEACSKPGKLCRYVPGVSADQWKVSVVNGAIGGCIVGAACRTGGRRWNWPFVLLFSPLWGIFGVSFGLGPVVQRVDGVTVEVVSVVMAFALCVGVVWLWVPRSFGGPGQEKR